MYEVIPLGPGGAEAGAFGPYTWAEAIAELGDAPWYHGVIIRPIEAEDDDESL